MQNQFSKTIFHFYLQLQLQLVIDDPADLQTRILSVAAPPTSNLQDLSGQDDEPDCTEKQILLSEEAVSPG